MLMLYDLLYAHIKEAYCSTAIPPLSRSDHNLTLQPAMVRTVKEWSKENSAALQDSLETMNWDALYEPHGKDVNSFIHHVTDYMN